MGKLSYYLYKKGLNISQSPYSIDIASLFIKPILFFSIIRAARVDDLPKKDRSGFAEQGTVELITGFL